MIVCPNSLCNEYLQKSELDSHITNNCPSVIVPCTNVAAGCTFRAPRRDIAAHEWQCKFRQKSSESSLTSVTLSSTSSVFQTDATGSQDILNHHSGNLSKYYFQNNSLYTPLNHMDGSESTNEDFCITITNPDRLEFGISFVGGYDTPLQCIVVQDIFRDGLVATDARLRPGDQIVKVNEYNLARAAHIECRDILSRICLSGDTIYLTIHRDIAERRWPQGLKEEILNFVIEKPSNKKMGLKLAGKTNKPGLYIQEVFPESLASQDGRLKKDDRILKINENDLVFGTQEEALEIIKNTKDHVTFVICRTLRPQTPDIIRAASLDLDNSTPIATSMSFPGLKSNSTFGYHPSDTSSFAFNTSCSSKSIYREEVVVVDKRPGESLGMSVAGGVNSQRGDTPVYITNIAPNSLLKKANGIDKGDILLAVNETELLGLSHERAVEALRLARDNCNKVTVRVLKVPNVPPTVNSENFIPPWLYWLRLPGYCQIPRIIILARDASTGSLGFSIVGGNDPVSGMGSTSLISNFPVDSFASTDSVGDKKQTNRPIMIKSIVYGSPAHKNGRLKCGDILISINDVSLANVSHSEAVNLFKLSPAPLNLKVVSWPGTIV